MKEFEVSNREARRMLRMLEIKSSETTMRPMKVLYPEADISYLHF